MNIEKIFTALKEDESNSALAIIVSELEKQWYKVKINNVAIDAEETDEGYFTDFERSSQEFEFTLLKNKQIDQRFIVEFVDFHCIVFKSFNN